MKEQTYPLEIDHRGNHCSMKLRRYQREALGSDVRVRISRMNFFGVEK